MEFRTTLRMPESKGLLRHSDGVVMLGSCFSESVGGRMRDALMRVCVNPMGTLYNAGSIAASVRRLIAGTPVAGNELFMSGGLWSHFDFHSRFSLPDKDAALTRMNRAIADGHDQLKSCRLLAITLGSAIAYRDKESGAIVANCHKLPAHRFDRRMMSLDEVVGALRDIKEMMAAFNPQCHIVLTVSPIRHIADGLERNSLSKAVLRVAASEVATGEDVSYFPSYEIMMDDLRDYRFYAADMLHPSETAVEYIWQAFQATYLDDASAAAVARCERVSKRLRHRVMNAGAETASRFANDTRTVVENLIKEYPYLSEHPLLQVGS